MSEPNAEPSSAEPVSPSAGAGSPSSDAPGEPAAEQASEKFDVDAASLVAPTLVPGQGEDSEGPMEKAAEAPKDTTMADTPRRSNVMIMASADRAWDGRTAGPDVESGSASSLFGRRRRLALAAVMALAIVSGALGGALATAALTHSADGNAGSPDTGAIGASVARIDADVTALKADVEHAVKLGTAQFNKSSDRLDKAEKVQVDSAAKLARLSEAVDKLHAALPAVPPAAGALAGGREITGSVSPSPVPPAAAPKVEIGRLPTVEGWVLRDVANGGALIEGRQGIYEVYAGDPVPGLGRIDAIRRQDGRWVVVTSRGLIVAH